MAASKACALFVCLTILPFAVGRASVSAEQPGGLTRDYRYMMGTSIEVEAYGADEQTRRMAIEEAFGAFAEIDRLMSNYRDDSELSRINRDAAREAVTVSDPMLSVLAAAQEISEHSHGAFDITVGPIVRLWGFHDKKPHLPTDAEFAAARPLVDYRNVRIDRNQHAVRFLRAGVELDLGGIAKGFAVEVAANSLRRHGLSGFIDAGGNQYLLGTPPHKPRWTTGIKSPDMPEHLLGVVETGETSVSTSADYSTFLEINGRTYGHIIDPHTLTPSKGALSVTILSRDGTMADAMSKAVFVLGPAEGLRLVDSIPGMFAVVVFRRSDGSTGVAISKGLVGSFQLTDARLSVDPT